jgi:hypothetical protein
MSAIGVRSAVISIGPSCQASHQINANIPLLRELLRDPMLEERAFPFDSLICPPSSAAALLRRKDRLPNEGDLEWVTRPFWRDAKLHFFHHFRNETNDAVTGGEAFAATRRKFERRWRRFDRLRKLHDHRLIFVLANVQNNYPEQAAAFGYFDPVIRSSEINDLVRSLDDALSRSFELLFVTDPARFHIDGALARNVRVREQAPFMPDWTGDTSAWATTFRTSFGRSFAARILRTSLRLVRL